MNSLIKKTMLLGLAATTLAACQTGSFTKDIFQTADFGYCAQIGRGSETCRFAILDREHRRSGEEEYTYYVAFNREQKASYYKLSGEFTGKTVDRAEYVDAHTVYVYVGGTSTTGSTGTVFGSVTIDSAAYQIVDPELKGSTISLTIALGDTAGQVEKEYSY